MISRCELHELRSEWSVAVDVIEKDNVLGWLLAGIAQGTALRLSRALSWQLGLRR